MLPDDLTMLRELTLLLDLAYQHHYASDPSAAHHYKSAEGTLRLEFGSLFWRQDRVARVGSIPEIESVVIYSSVFSAARVSHFDTLDDAIGVVGAWYAEAKAASGL